MRQIVGVETRHTTFAKSIEDVALARRDATGQSDFQHRAGKAGRAGGAGWGGLYCLPYRPYRPYRPPPMRSVAAFNVFFSNITIVSGPTPPGTGDSAPATLATSG